MWTFNNTKDWQQLKEKYTWVADMYDVPQDAIHHAEGNVGIHTDMVLKALLQMEEYLELLPQEREILWAAALFHDIEKGSTTVTEQDGSITSKGHARKGAMTVRRLLYKEYPAPFHIREHVVNLVRYHGLPIWAIEKPNAAKAVIEASLVVDTKLLAILATADALGRECADKEDLLYRIGLFKALCMENNCWGNSRKFQTGNALFEYFSKSDDYPDFVPFDDFNSSVILLAGLPGSGKDTLISKSYKDWPIVSLDDIRRKMKISPTDKSGNGKVIQAAKELARTYLRRGDNFVWNATNITKSMREQLVELFTTYKAHVTIVYVEVPFKLLLQQNKNREHALPQLALERLIAKLEVPAPWEGHELVYHVIM